VLPAWLAETATEFSAPAAVETGVAPAAHEPVITDVPRRIDLPPAPLAEQATAPDTAAVTTPVVETPGPFTWRSLVPWIVPLWAAGMLVVLASPFVGLWQLSKLCRGAELLADETWNRQLSEICTQLGLRRRVRLLTSPAALMPLTFGAWRPVLLMPTEATDWTPQRRRLVLLHELAHIRRWDWLTHMVAHAACAAHWFNPLAWLAARRMQIEREKACDDLVLASGAKASDYARELLAIAANHDGRPLMALAAVPMARRSALEDRLQAVLDTRRNRAALTAATGLVALSLLGAVLIPLAMLQAAAPQTPAEDAITTPAAQPEKPAE